MDECLFCKIIAKEIPADIVYEDDVVIAFLDIHPKAPGHTLVVPKVHSVDVATTTAEQFEKLSARLPKLGAAIMAAVDAQGFNLTFNNGAAAGQVIPHLHAHIISRFSKEVSGATTEVVDKEQLVKNIKTRLL